MHLTQSEMEIMQAYWKYNKPMSLNELIEVSPNRTWKDRSGFSIINNLIKKGFLKEESYIHSGKTIARTFTPIVGCTEYMISQWEDYSENIKFSQLFAGLLGNKKMKAEDINELDKLIAKKKKDCK